MKLVIPDHVLAQSIDDELVLLNIETNLTYGLDAIATAFWKGLDRHDGDLDRVVSDLLAAFEVEETTLRADLGELTAYLASEDLLRKGA